MSATSSRPTRRMPSRALVLVAAVGAVALLASCGSTDQPSTRPTVTVTVDPPTGASGTGAGSPSAIPTATATSADLPTAMAAGAQRGAPKSFEEAKARIDKAKPDATVTTRFVSPTGNIVCQRSTDSTAAACEVAKGRVSPPLPTVCPAQGPKDIGRVELRQDGAYPVCNRDSIRKGGEPTLPYGSRTQPSGTTACISEEYGVTCIDTATAHGFFLAKDTFVTF
ncbi:hypothetical protein [Terrabacter sp. NPDC080008]|uniref:hypothetical protein n=1 Tax=Terrabacter sp. NPDC080008 TaxID=3155176 RepID=UPI00344B622F